MPMSPDDRKTFSLKIVSAAGEIATYQQAKIQLQQAVDALQAQDTANANLFNPTNAKVNLYQQEISLLDGNQREVITEQDIQDAAAIKIRNHFYPNDTTASVPPLAGSNNVWTKAKPFALTYAIGKNYSAGYTQITNETATLASILTLIATIQSGTDIGNTTGESVTTPAPTGTPPVAGTPTLGPDATIQANKTALVALINTLQTLLNSESSAIVTTESDATILAQNNAAKANITNVILPAIATWLAYPDFNTTGVTAANYATFDPNLIAPTKLHSVQLTALKTAITNRSTFVTTRLGQLNTVLGSITQDLSTGDVTAQSGLYGRRYGFMLLRLDLLNGSLSKLSSMKQAAGAQDSIISSINSAKSTYLSVLPTSGLQAAGNGTSLIQLNDASLFAVGDTVYVVSETQDELLRAIKSINGNAVTLNDVIPAKYKPTDMVRVYKDLT